MNLIYLTTHIKHRYENVHITCVSPMFSGNTILCVQSVYSKHMFDMAWKLARVSHLLLHEQV